MATIPVSARDVRGEVLEAKLQDLRISSTAFLRIVLVAYTGPGRYEEVMLLGKLYI